MLILFIATVIVSALWQPAVIALIAWIALRLSRCSNATTRHAVWSIALVASVALPLISAAPLLLPKQSPAEPVMYHLPAVVSHVQIPARAAHAKASAPSSVEPSVAPTIDRPHFHVRATFAQIVTGAWAAIALVILGRLVFSFLYLERLKHDALPLSVERRKELSRWERADKGLRDVRICVSPEITVPVAVGIFDAMILLPQDLVEELEPTDLDRILLHELAHVRRSDDWVNLFERIAVALLFFSPGIYWIARQMDLEREVACDDWVLAQAAENVPYARCLTRIVEMTQWPHRPVAAPGVFVTRKSMSIRIERLLARGRDIRIRLAVVPSLISIVAIAAIVIAGGFVSPTIAYTMDSTSVALKPAAPAPKAKKSMAPAHAPTMPPNADIASSNLDAALHPKVRATLRTTVATKTETRTAISAKATVAVVPVIDVTGTPEVVADAGYLDELAAAGLKNLSADDVIQLKSVGVTSDYIRGLRDAGMTNVSPRLLVELKSVGVTPQYISQMRAAGLAASDARLWTELKSVGVTPEYAAQMRSAGVTDYDIRRLVELKSVGVTPDYVSQMRSAGLGSSDARTLTEMKSIGLTPDYVHQMRNLGVTGGTVRDLSELKSVGVTPDYVQELANAGYPHLTCREYTEMKSIGVSGDYIKNLKNHGFSGLSVQKLVQFKAEGIEPK